MMPDPSRPHDRRTFLRRGLAATIAGPFVVEVSARGTTTPGAVAQGTQDVAWSFLIKYNDGWLPLDTAASEAAWGPRPTSAEAHTAAQVDARLRRSTGSSATPR